MTTSEAGRIVHLDPRKGRGPVPQSVLKASAQIRKLQKGQRASCKRCGGQAYCEDKKTWIVAKGKKGLGKVCFRCRGDGLEPKDPTVPQHDPLAVRREVVGLLTMQVKALCLEDVRILASLYKDSIYWPVLEDAFLRAEKTIKETLRYLQMAGRSIRGVCNCSYPDSEEMTRHAPFCGVNRMNTPEEPRFSSSGLDTYFLEVLMKHHPGASYEELQNVSGGRYVSPSFIPAAAQLFRDDNEFSWGTPDEFSDSDF